jgi:transposase-like protein
MPGLRCRASGTPREPPPAFIPGTNAIESVNARIRRAVRARGHFPNEQAALKCVYLAVMSLDPTGKGRKRWVTRWEPP